MFNIILIGTCYPTLPILSKIKERESKKGIIFFSLFGKQNSVNKLPNGTACFKKCKQLFEYQHFLLLIDIWFVKALINI